MSVTNQSVEKAGQFDIDTTRELNPQAELLEARRLATEKYQRVQELSALLVTIDADLADPLAPKSDDTHPLLLRVADSEEEVSTAAARALFAASFARHEAAELFMESSLRSLKYQAIPPAVFEDVAAPAKKRRTKKAAAPDTEKPATTRRKRKVAEPVVPVSDETVVICEENIAPGDC